MCAWQRVHGEFEQAALQTSAFRSGFIMQTVGSARKWALDELKRARISSAAQTADLLVGFVLGWDRIRVMIHSEQELPDEAWILLRSLILRRSNGEPVQYLTGRQEFYGLSFQVTPQVLIPRPETEIMVEKALNLVRRHLLSSIRFVDIGTGSGCIAVSIAHEVPTSIGWAVDISPAALKVARKNAIRHGVAGRILFVQSDLLESFPRTPCLNFILCNPPYIAISECDSLPSEVRDHEPQEALFGGESGLEIYQRLIPEVSSRLVAGGYLLLEVGLGQAKQVGQLIEKENLALQEVINDLQGIPRCLVGRKISQEK
jgi:release factor glutamine methyltransferase